jgi:CBS domain-containing protein
LTTDDPRTTGAREPRLDRAARVEDGMKLLAIEPLLVNVHDDLFAIMARAARQPSTRLIGVVDDDGRLVGVIRIRDLVEDVLAHTIPEALMSDLASVDDVARFGHQVETHTAADAMLPPAAVSSDASIVAAFRRMLKDGLSGVYVVDADQRPTGYLDRLELAYLATRGLPSAAGHASDD